MTDSELHHLLDTQYPDLRVHINDAPFKSSRWDMYIVGCASWGLDTAVSVETAEEQILDNLLFAVAQQIRQYEVIQKDLLTRYQERNKNKYPIVFQGLRDDITIL